jgi:hypothetical protein
MVVAPPCDDRLKDIAVRERLIAIVALLVLGVGVYVSANAVSGLRDSHPVRILEHERMGFTDADLRTLDAGGVVAKSLDTGLRREVAVVGVVWIGVPPDFFVEQYRDIETFEADPDRVPQIGRFRDPPMLDDLEMLSLDTADLGAIVRCRSGDCDLKLTVPAMIRLQRETDWALPGAAERANRVARQMLLELVQAYQNGGNTALGSYEDHDRPFPVAEEFQAMLHNEPLLLAHLPALQDFLNHYPAHSLPGAEDFFYWSKVSFGLKPTIRANHVTIYRLPEGAPIVYALASKQLYSSHYFNTALELRLVVGDARRPDAVGFFLVNVNRSRVDRLSGLSGLIIRSTILRKTRDAMTAYLRRAKQTREGQWFRHVNEAAGGGRHLRAHGRT